VRARSPCGDDIPPITDFGQFLACSCIGIGVALLGGVAVNTFSAESASTSSGDVGMSTPQLR
jgi:hypothetical protein